MFEGISFNNMGIQPPSNINVNTDDTVDLRAISVFRNSTDFIERINLPRSIKIGTEIVSTNEPFLVLKREKSWGEELTNKPCFYVTKKVRLCFHWDGIQVVGSNMEKPNCFVFPVPRDRAKWYLKVICLPGCTPGTKPLYVSVSTFGENVLLKAVSIIVKFLASLAFLSLLIFPFLYFISDTVRIYINNIIIGEPSTGFITIASLFLFSVITFSKRFDEIFSTLKEEHDTLVFSETGLKMINPQGIIVTED